MNNAVMELQNSSEVTIKLGKKGRVCEFKGCKTILNQRNLSKFCYRHQSVVRVKLQDAYVKSFDCQPLERAKFRRKFKELEKLLEM